MHQEETHASVQSEIEHFNERAKLRFVPRQIDILEHYYLPLTTLATQGAPHRLDNRFCFYQRHFDVLEQYRGKKVLNVACGIGELSLLMAHMGIEVYAFDFAPEAVAVAREMARINGYEDRIHVDEMDVRNLTYPPDMFDLVTGEHALHHLIKFPGSLENLYRVLKPGCMAYFWENFTFDPLVRLLRPINWYVKGYVGEHSLGKEDLEYARRVFDEVRVTDQSVLFTYSRFLRRKNAVCRAGTRFLKRADDVLLTGMPFLKRFYSLAFLELHKTMPSKSD